MIDFHSHILPDMDDGSKSVGEATDMLKFSFKMGIDTIVSTSHYYADCDTISSFLVRRNEKQQLLIHNLEGIIETPKIVMGAEVAFFSGMSREKEIARLCIDSTKYMLIEMPFSEWSSLTINEVKSLITNRGITPILAHIERYLTYQKKNGKIAELLNLGVILQINSEALINCPYKRDILKMIDKNQIHLLGSDCHNMSNRKPNLDLAFKAITRKLGNSTLKNIDFYGRRILSDKCL